MRDSLFHIKGSLLEFYYSCELLRYNLEIIARRVHIIFSKRFSSRLIALVSSRIVIIIVKMRNFDIFP